MSKSNKKFMRSGTPKNFFCIGLGNLQNILFFREEQGEGRVDHHPILRHDGKNCIFGYQRPDKFTARALVPAKVMRGRI